LKKYYYQMMQGNILNCYVACLCWIHEIRLCKKLNPVIEHHRLLLEKFISKLWDYYDKLNDYRDKPDEKVKEELEKQFDELFSTKTGYAELDKRIALSKEKKEELLLVLKFPEIPLHNNPAELALREGVVKRKLGMVREVRMERLLGKI